MALGCTSARKLSETETVGFKYTVLIIYDVNKPVTISGDGISKGLGVVLLQDGHPIGYGSRALTETQKRYAQIEREMLAIVYGCEKFHHYIFRRPLIVETDHKPLVAIYS